MKSETSESELLDDEKLLLLEGPRGWRRLGCWPGFLSEVNPRH